MTIEEMLANARRKDADRQLADFDQAALDIAARLGLGNGAFEESDEDGSVVVEEFFSDTQSAQQLPSKVDSDGGKPDLVVQGKSSLATKLDAKADSLVS